MRKNRVGVFTINGYNNYGNRLQLFALSRVLSRLGCEVEVFWPRSFKSRIKRFLEYDTFLRIKYKKEVKIRRFSRRHLPRITNCRNVDYSVIGSDQVWNPYWLPKMLYLLNIPNDSVKISYAASMGMSTLTKEQGALFKKYLKDYSSISVREETAKKLLQPYTEKEIEVVLDPTLLLDKLEYEKIEKRPRDISRDEKYILCYILGGRESWSTISDYAKKNDCRIIAFSDKEQSDYGIEEFLYLIHHAELICTDSFHACVFSFIFERPFVVFRRSGNADNMYSRLENFLKVFHFTNREFDGDSIKRENVIINFEHSKKILSSEREKSLNYLKTALELENENK